ncbi:hypothetical protein Tco_0550847 [Tanacetum coccineum]
MLSSISSWNMASVCNAERLLGHCIVRRAFVCMRKSHRGSERGFLLIFRRDFEELAYLSTVDNADEVTIGSWLFSWRKAYSRCPGNSFNSSLGGSKLDGFNRFFEAFHSSGSTSSILGEKETASAPLESSSSSSSVYFPSWVYCIKPLTWTDS